ncbi:hypothetical protein B0J15DRAFT_150734 [Fusarium solani]|uniref:Secreted protein n=1 Tax=Fusarium solani TaxID=169388 RepID=A0A9P9GAM1_FUSSL|nr:uncharacterized protein B0J15DRAFT_150734 [Fusarium solani]KAH7235238.1 hypothetical protein B0J15DRAFT_150734 [Fusarium solani]
MFLAGLLLCSLLALSPAWDWGIIVSCRHARRVRGLHPWCEMQPQTPQQPKIRSECQSRSRAKAGDQEIQSVQCILQFLSCEWVFVAEGSSARSLDGITVINCISIKSHHGDHQDQA